MEQALLEADLVPAERDELAHAQAVAVGNHDHRRVALAVTTELAGSRDELLDLGGGQVLAAAELELGGAGVEGGDHGSEGRTALSMVRPWAEATTAGAV